MRDLFREDYNILSVAAEGKVNKSPASGSGCVHIPGSSALDLSHSEAGHDPCLRDGCGRLRSADPANDAPDGCRSRRAFGLQVNDRDDVSVTYFVFVQDILKYDNLASPLRSLRRQFFGALIK